MQQRTLHKILLLLLPCMLITNMAYAEVTEVNLRSAILGRVTFTPTEMTEMDLNGDTKVDVADLITFITADGTPAVWFTNAELTVTEIQGALNIPISLSKSFDGNLQVQVSGTAASDDYTPFSLLIPVTQGASQVSIPLNVLSDALLEGTETLVISLLDPGAGNTYRTALPSVVRVLIKDGSNGTCQGTLSSQAGIKLPAQSIGFVIDGGNATFTMEESSLLPSSFVISATGDGINTLDLTGTASGSFAAPVLNNRLVHWQLNFSDSSLSDGFFTADYTLSYDQGLTASSVPFVMQGKIRCNMLE